MAIYSLNLGFISRSEGRSAVGFSAYIGGQKVRDLRRGKSYDYASKENVIVNRILAPEGAPLWMRESSSLWNAIEAYEDQYADLRFRGHPKSEEKNQRSLEAKAHFLASAQTAQTIMGALPYEFTQLEAEACVEEFLSDRFVSRGLVVEYAIHWEEGNPHFHGLITRRAVVEGDKEDEEATFALRKDRDIVSKVELLVTRKQWEGAVNKHLALGGHEVRIDCRSYKDQGLGFLPTHHEGWYAQHLAERGGHSRIAAENDQIRQKNIEILSQNPSVLIHELSLKRTLFTRTHIEDELIRRVGGDQKLYDLLRAKVTGLEIPSELILNQANDNRESTIEGSGDLRRLAGQFTDQVLQNNDIVSRVGENLNRETLFTSTAYKKQEETIIELGDRLEGQNTKSVSPFVLSQAIKDREAELGFNLSEEQRTAIEHLCGGPDLRILNGKAGTGKTTLLKAVAQAYEESGYRVLGTSFQGKAVEIMEKEIGIPSRTLDSLILSWEKHQTFTEILNKPILWGTTYRYAQKVLSELKADQLTDKDVLIVDEANMVGNRLWEPFLNEVTDKGAKVLIVQDPAQIKSREPGDTGQLFAERYGYAETTEVVRQRTSWQRECSKALNDHQVLDGLMPYYEKGHLKWTEGPETTLQTLTQAYMDDLNTHPTQSRMALAYRNAEVYELNQSIREALMEKGYLQGGLGGEFKIKGQSYCIGDKIRFTQNDHQGRYVKTLSSQNGESLVKHGTLGVKNGTLGTITGYEEEEGIKLLTVLLEDSRRVQINLKEYAHITHGYAMTIHKSEGSTFDKAFVSLDAMMDPSSLLVAMTRHREDVAVYVNQDHFVDFKALVDQVGRPQPHNLTLQDYQVADHQRPSFERVQTYKDLIHEAATLREEIEAQTESASEFYQHASYKTYQSLYAQKRDLASQMLKDWKVHAPYTKLAGIRKDILEVEAGLRPRLLSDLEHKAEIQVQLYMDHTRTARALWKQISETHPGTLAPSHSLYEEYKHHKTERDSIAATIQENPKLYAPFFRMTKEEQKDPVTLKEHRPIHSSSEYKDYWGEALTSEGRVFWSGIKAHAKAHLNSQTQNLYYERLTEKERARYDDVKAYVKVRNEVAALYGQLKKESHVPTEMNLKTFQQAQHQRDVLALKLVESPEKYQQYFTTLNSRKTNFLSTRLRESSEKRSCHMPKSTTLRIEPIKRKN